MSTTIVLELINLAAELNEHQKFGETKFMLLQEISIMANLLASLFCLFCEIYFQFKMLKENLDDSNNRSNTLVCCNKNFLAKLRRYEMYRLKLKTIMLLLLLFDFTGIVLAVCINFLGVSLPVIATDCILNALIVMHSWAGFSLLMIYKNGHADGIKKLKKKKMRTPTVTLLSSVNAVSLTNTSDILS
ncbi:hypothetical protein HK099_002137 [Clydaea vesicula]|uniref:Uncharacterized protein n=1 Tax=Clydaea vesicula TaxID=447962 RepID=A0AAD5XWY2_9FUNG|nr:hypothetical protein HK099_002137 [Clydaea vesicula]